MAYFGFRLASGTFEAGDNMDGWVITSDVAIADGNEDMPLRKGDRIDLDGNVRRRIAVNSKEASYSHAAADAAEQGYTHYWEDIGSL